MKYDSQCGCYLVSFVAIMATCALGGENTADVIYGPPVKLALVEDPAIEESSGLARCHSRDDALWTHNDSGDRARLFLIGTNGRTLGTAKVQGVKPDDWEDMCSFRRNGKSYLLIGDIGDNQQQRRELTLCLVEEPDARVVESPAVWHLQPVALIPLRLEGGPRNCEALAVDAAGGTILLASKSLAGGCQIFQAAWDWAAATRGQAATARPAEPTASSAAFPPLSAKPIAHAEIPLATGMDISEDGRRAIIVSYLGGYEWTRRDGEDWAAALARPPRFLPLPIRSQGEAICYGADDRSLYLTSEGRSQPLWLVPAQKTAGP